MSLRDLLASYNAGILRARAEYARTIQRHEQPIPKPPAACGTVSGVHRHRRRGEDVCDECRQARRTYDRERYAARKGKA